MKLTVTQLFKKSPTFHGIRRFTTVFTIACHWSLSWSRCIQSTTSNPTPLICILILFSNLHLDLPNDHFPSGLPIKFNMHFYLSMHATCQSPLILLDLITLIIFFEAQKLWSSSLYSLLQPTATSSVLGENLGQNILNTLF